MHAILPAIGIFWRLIGVWEEHERRLKCGRAISLNVVEEKLQGEDFDSVMEAVWIYFIERNTKTSDIFIIHRSSH